MSTGIHPPPNPYEATALDAHCHTCLKPLRKYAEVTRAPGDRDVPFCPTHGYIDDGEATETYAYLIVQAMTETNADDEPQLIVWGGASLRIMRLLDEGLHMSAATVTAAREHRHFLKTGTYPPRVQRAVSRFLDATWYLA